MAKGMTKWQARKEKKRQKLGDDYQEYLKKLKKRGRASHRKALTEYAWRKATAATRAVERTKAVS